jgi:hypothetical protein
VQGFSPCTQKKIIKEPNDKTAYLPERTGRTLQSDMLLGGSQSSMTLPLRKLMPAYLPEFMSDPQTIKDVRLINFVK